MKINKMSWDYLLSCTSNQKYKFSGRSNISSYHKNTNTIDSFIFKFIVLR